MSTKPLWTTPPEPPAPVRVASPVPGVGVGTPWGKKPNDSTYWRARGHHTGDDYPGREGADVVAVLDGTIRYYTDSVLGLIILLYAYVDGHPVTFWYCHLSSRTAPTGRVKAGQRIGRVGHTGSGAKFGPHLHFERRAGHSTDWSGKDVRPTW